MSTCCMLLVSSVVAVAAVVAVAVAAAVAVVVAAAVVAVVAAAVAAAAASVLPPLSVGLRITGFDVGIEFVRMKPLFHVAGDGKNDLGKSGFGVWGLHDFI